MKKLFSITTLLLAFLTLTFAAPTVSYKIVDSDNNSMVGLLTLESYSATNYVNQTNYVPVYQTNIVNVPVDVPVYTTNVVTVTLTNTVTMTNIVYVTNTIPPVVTTTNKLPTVAITSPTNGQVFQGTSATINVNASASDPDGSISKVEFYVEGGLSNTDTSAPYSYNSLYGQGSYALQAKAYDNSNAVASSSIVNILVTNVVTTPTPTNNPPTTTNTPPTGTLRYVRAGATGANNGADWNNAFTSLPATLVRGCTYYVAGGSYSGYTFNTAVSGTSIVLVKKATASEHGTNTGWIDTYGTSQAIFNGQINVTKNYFVFDGATGGGPGSWTSNLGFKVVVLSGSPAIAINMLQMSASASDISFLHTQVSGNGGSNQGGGGSGNDAFAFYGQVSNIRVAYCSSDNMGRCHVFSSGQNVTIEYSYFGKHKSSAATHSEIMSIDPQLGSAVKNWTVRYCLFTHAEGTGGIMFNGDGMDCYGNVFYRPAGDTWETGNGVVGGWTGASGEKMLNFRVYNNSFINISTTVLTTLPQTFSGCRAWNNIFYNCSSPSFIKFTSHDYNYFINSGGVSGEANGKTGTSDPFVDYVNWNFKLKTATGAGSNLGVPYNFDGLGSQRGADGNWDIGAYEF